MFIHRGIVGATILGSEGFVAGFQEQYVDVARSDRNLPALQQFRGRPTIEQIIEAVETAIGSNENLVKKVAIHICHRHSGAKLKEIDERFKVNIAIGVRSQPYTVKSFLCYAGKTNTGIQKE